MTAPALSFNPNHDELGRFAEGGGGGGRELSSSEAAAVQAYAGQTYWEINGGLRSGAQLSPELSSAIAHLDSAFTAATTLSQPATVFRGVHASRVPDHVGQVYSDAGYVSTSLSTSVAGYFGEGNTVTILLPKGAHVLNVSGRLGTEWSKMEKEILLPRGSRFKVKTVDSAGNTVMELIP